MNKQNKSFRGAKEPRSLAQSKYQNVEWSELFKVIDGSETYDDERGLTPNEKGGRGKVIISIIKKFIFGIIEIYILSTDS
jgi:hypothetical protein